MSGGENKMRITKRPDERRKEIVAAARELFALNGFVKTTISDIANRIGIAKGLFYYYFKTKDDVMNAVIEEYIDETERKVWILVEQTNRDYLERLSELIFIIIGFSRDTETVFAELKKSDRFMFHQSILDHAIRRLQKVVSGMVEEGVQKKIIRCKHPGITVEILFYGFGMVDMTRLSADQIQDIVVHALDIEIPSRHSS